MHILGCQGWGFQRLVVKNRKLVPLFRKPSLFPKDGRTSGRMKEGRPKVYEALDWDDLPNPPSLQNSPLFPVRARLRGSPLRIPSFALLHRQPFLWPLKTILEEKAKKKKTWQTEHSESSMAKQHTHLTP